MRRPSMLAAILVGLAVLTTASPASAMYHPTVGKWAARDPDGYGASMSLYEYALSCPPRYADYNGRESQDMAIGVAAAVDAVAPSNLVYPSLTGLDTFADNLRMTLWEHISGFRPYVEDPKASAEYSPWSQTLGLKPGFTNDNVIHELTHGLYHLQNGWWWTHYSSERLAYGQGLIRESLRTLSNVESMIAAREPCAEINRVWNNVWTKLLQNFGAGGMQGGQYEYLHSPAIFGIKVTGTLELGDVDFIAKQLGIKANCKGLEKAYNDRMASEGLPAKALGDGCCTVRCPDGLPECFR